jgi:thymidylate synthase (FAD)
MTTEIQLTSEITTRPVQSVGGDHMVVAAARVSTSGEDALRYAEPGSADENTGLINYLVKSRHGCYDPWTEVLTRDGWKRWDEVDGKESFATLDGYGNIVYQEAQRLVVEEVRGSMVRIQTKRVDLLVTPDHNLFARRDTGQKTWAPYGFTPAKDVLLNPHLVWTGGGAWDGNDEKYDEARLELLGCVIAAETPAIGIAVREVLKLADHRVQPLIRAVALAGFSLNIRGGYGYLTGDEGFHALVEECYDENRTKSIPRRLLRELGPRSLRAILRGLRSLNPGRKGRDRRIFITDNPKLAGQIQELALKIGRAATITSVALTGEGRKGAETWGYRVKLTRRKKLETAVGLSCRGQIHDDHAKIEKYSGKVYCVTVPNGTLYVRRNGKPCWCGNSPFEHSSLTFFVHAPIFVFREWMRHRIGHSFSEASARYSKLEPIFWVPRYERRSMPIDGYKPSRPRFQTIEEWVRKSMRDLRDQWTTHAEFLDICRQTYDEEIERNRAVYELAYRNYEASIEAGWSNEVARCKLPVGIYSSCWVTVNPRSLMHFLSLRTFEPEAKYVSFPQAEIEEAARACESAFAAGWPITHKAFCDNGRVAP